MSSLTPSKPDLTSTNSTVTSTCSSSICLSHSKVVIDSQTESSNLQTTTSPNMLFRSVSANDAVPRVCRSCRMSNEMLHLYGLYAVDLIPSSHLEDDLLHHKSLSSLSIEESPCNFIKQQRQQAKIAPSINITTTINPSPVWETESSSASSASGLEAVSDTPANFSEVLPGVYRSSFPAEEHFEYLRSLGLKSVVSLVSDEYPEPNVQFMVENGIRHFKIGLPGKRDSLEYVPLEKITEAVGIVLDRANHPVLIHCNKGKHRTGCIVACLRKVQRWSLPVIIEEYRQFSWPKSRDNDEKTIAMWDESELGPTALSFGGWVDDEDTKATLPQDDLVA